MSESAETDAPWKCPKPDCLEGIDAHNLARFLDHMLYDEPGFTADDAQGIADRVLAKADAALGDDIASRVFGTNVTSPGAPTPQADTEDTHEQEDQ